MKKICKECGNEFTSNRKNQKYCGSVSLKNGCSYQNNLNQRYSARNKFNAKWRDTPSGKFSVYRGNAKIRGIDFSITKDEFNDLWNMPCHYCGDKIETIGIDRIENSIGYVAGNIIPCCKYCNYMKSSMDISKFLYMVEKIYNKSIAKK